MELTVNFAMNAIHTTPANPSQEGRVRLGTRTPIVGDPGYRYAVTSYATLRHCVKPDSHRIPLAMVDPYVAVNRPPTSQCQRVQVLFIATMVVSKTQIRH